MPVFDGLKNEGGDEFGLVGERTEAPPAAVNKESATRNVRQGAVETPLGIALHNGVDPTGTLCVYGINAQNDVGAAGVASNPIFVGIQFGPANPMGPANWLVYYRPTH